MSNYFPTDDNTCQQCSIFIDGCATCESKTTCKECTSGKELKDGKCQDSSSLSGVTIFICVCVGIFAAVAIGNSFYM